ncbi:MAG TPA: hypothetical protein VMC03_11225 [Streptosporangiaceae bacterium]|nr:hypothetical protein [Streptosporangiaceae bacterium]
MSDAAGTSGTKAVDAALQGFRDMLAADGYRLNWSVTEPQRVLIQIEAGPDACADCLVPLPVIEGIMTDALAKTGYALDRVVLPAGEAHRAAD